MQPFPCHRGHCALLGALALAATATAQLPAPADSLLAEAASDSEVFVLPDSLSQAFADSAFVDSTATSADDWLAAPDFGPGEFSRRDQERELPEGLDAMLRRVPDLQLRVNGERGADSYLNLSPIGEVMPEILLDGIPQRSPADLDPAVYDVSAGDLEALRVTRGHFGAGGEIGLRLSRTQPLPGRTLSRAHFSKTEGETYYRSLAATTPEAQHRLRFDFEEWKSELGVDYADLPTVNTTSLFGYAKQRRFHVGLVSRAPFGQVLAGFGRGRRRSPGSILGSSRDADGIERWSGQAYVGMDRHGEHSLQTLRVYQVDLREVEEQSRRQLAEPKSVGQRLGVRWERLSQGQGWNGLLWVERRSARWSDGSTPGPQARGQWVSHAGLSRLWQRGSWSLRAGTHGAYAERLDASDVGGSMKLAQDVGARWAWELGALRSLRVPSLLESDGFRSVDMIDGVRRTQIGGSGLEIERQDRLHLGAMLRLGRWHSELRVESWSLSRGVGQELRGDELHFVGDVSTQVEQVFARSQLSGRLRRLSWSFDVAGHRVLGELESEAGRGAGWPTSGGQARARADHPFFSPRNRLIAEAFLKWAGPRLDDRMAVVAAPTLGQQQWTELRAALRIRDAEIYLAWDNLLDADYSETLGTLRRPRQLRWGLYWTFYN